MVGAGVALQLRGVCREHDPHVVAADDQAPRYDEAVAAVVAGAAQHEHMFRSARLEPALGNEPLDDLARTAPRVLHQDNARHVALDGLGVECADLLP